MFKHLAWIIAIFAFAVAIGCLFTHLNGSISLLLDRTVYTFSLKWMLYVFVLGIIGSYILYKIVALFWAIPRRLSKAHNSHTIDYVVDRINNASIAFFEGRYNNTLQQVDNLLKHKHVGVQVFALMLGAESANKINNLEKLDLYLSKTEERYPSNFPLSNLLRAEGALKEQDYQAFNEYCDNVKRCNPTLTALAQLQLAYALEVRQAPVILNVLRQLKNNCAISEKDYTQYELVAYQAKLAQVDSVDGLKKYCKELPQYLQQNEIIIVSVGRRYYGLAYYIDAVTWSLEKYHMVKNIELLGIILTSFMYLDGKHQNKTLRILEIYLEQDKENYELLLLLGNLSYRNKLWGKAQEYLETSVAIHPTALALVILSQLYSLQGFLEQANETNVKALELLCVLK